MGIKLAHSGVVLAAYRLLAAAFDRVPLPPGASRSRAGQRAAAARWRTWARHARGSGPIVWAHGASVGEQQVLEPILRRLARARPDLRVVLSHTSPSVLSTRPVPPVCHRDYLPLDRPPDVAAALDAVRPVLALFARSDLWPEFVTALAARAIPIVVAGASVRPGSRRLGAAARLALRAVHRRVAWLGAVTADDAGRWARIGVAPERIEVTGDPRHDRILERLADVRPPEAIRAWAAGQAVLVAGSVEPEDDRVLAAALARLGGAAPRTVIVPHDATDARVTTLRRRLASRGLPAGIWRGPASGQPLPPQPVVVVGAHGLLADLYLGGDLAYVGGGFRAGRLHALAEPAAFGIPAVIGPRWSGTADAAAMIGGGGALALPVHGAASTLAATLARLVRDPAERARRGLAARAALVPGASNATADVLLQLTAPRRGASEAPVRALSAAGGAIGSVRPGT